MSTTPTLPTAEPTPVAAPRTSIVNSQEQATIGKSLVIKGEVTGSESLYIDGRVEGAINLPKLSEEFYRSARWLRVYTASRAAINADGVHRLAARSAQEVRARLKEGESLLNW